MKAELHAGDQAPDFEGDAVSSGHDEPERFCLADRRGQRIVLCFYPSNEVPAATRQLSDLRDAWEHIGPQAQIVAVSCDAADHLRRQVVSLGLPFPLISDHDDLAAKAYGIWLGSGGSGDAEGGSSTERTTFVLDADGLITSILRNVDPASHAAQLAALLND